MKLKTCKINQRIIRHPFVTKHVGDQFDIQQFYLEEYDRTYDVFKIKNEHQSFVLKKVTKSQELMANDFLKNYSFKFIPHHYGSFSVDRESWMLYDYVEVEQNLTEESTLNDLTKHLGELHCRCFKDQEGILDMPFKKWQATQFSRLNDFSDELSSDEIHMVRKSQEILEDCHYTILHGDMIPLNVLNSPEGVKILDWEHAAYGPYILDITRLLGDYNKTKKWVQPEVAEKLLETYFTYVKDLLVDVNDHFMIHFHCGIIDNYLGILLSHKKNNWEQTDWYNLNMNALKTHVEILNRLLS